ncbi:hypothetical protein [Brevundimonas sp.]|uniref:hypothetical protein n=1 Tax=Brevundimonas sp. TaxID=1871086 RepID=UPI0028AA8AD2|nr:hypothetical protein [Brevundimonas sp.]
MTMTTRKDILDFLAAFPDREIWIDEEARLEASEYDHDALLASSIEDEGEGAAYHVDHDMTLPMLDDIEKYLKVDDLGSYLDDTGDSYIFEAFERGFVVNLYYYDVTGNRQDLGMDSRTVRVVASLEPDSQWDEDNEDEPLAMVWTHGRNYRFADATAPA